MKLTKPKKDNDYLAKNQNKIEECFLVVNFIYKNFLKDNGYNNRGNYAAAEYFANNLMKILTNLELILEKREHKDIIDILKSFKVSIVSDTTVKNSSRNDHVNYLMKPNKIVEELSNGKLQNLILRNYCYDQTQEYLNIMNNEREEVLKIRNKQDTNTLRMRKMGAKPFIWKWSRFRTPKGFDDLQKLLNQTWHPK